MRKLLILFIAVTVLNNCYASSDEQEINAQSEISVSNPNAPLDLRSSGKHWIHPQQASRFKNKFEDTAPSLKLSPTSKRKLLSSPLTKLIDE